MKINDLDLNKNDNSTSFIYHIEGTPVSIYATSQYENKNINVRAQISKIKGSQRNQVTRSIYSVPTWDEVGSSIDEICRLYELLCRANSDLNPLEIIELIHDELSTSKDLRQRRLRVCSMDNRYVMYVKKEKDSFIPKIKDTVTGDGGHLHPATCTEEEANRIITKQMENYNSKGCFCIKDVKNRRNTFEHECLVKEETQGILDEFLPQFDNIDEVREKLLDAKKIIDGLLGLGD